MRRIIFFLLLILLIMQPVLAQERSFTDLGANHLRLSGMYGAASMWLPFPSDQIISDAAEVTLHYIASPLLNTERSTLTIRANDVEVASLRPIADGQEQTFSFSIPAERLSGRGVNLVFQGYLRLTDDDCEETNNPGQWLTILGTSQVNVLTEPNTAAPTLAELPQAIIVQDAPTAPEVLVVLPENADDATLTTAAQVIARLAAGSNIHYQGVKVVHEVTEENADANLIFVGTLDTLPEEIRAALPASIEADHFISADGQPVPAEHGAVQILNSPWNEARKVLIVSAGSSEGLILAGNALADELIYQALNGEFEFITALDEPVAPAAGYPWQQAATTFAQLGAADRTLTGTGKFNEYYYFQRPPGWYMGSDATLTIRAAFSPVLRREESYVAVFINEVFIGAVQAEPEAQTVTFDLPTALLNQPQSGQALTVRIEITNHLNENNCEQTHPESAWTQISAQSAFNIPPLYAALPDVQVFPYPFVSSQTPTRIVLPQEPTDSELAAAFNLAAAMGQAAPLDFEVQVSTQASEETSKDQHLLVLGTPERQPLINEFLEEMAGINPDTLYQALDQEGVGILREAPSPWNRDRVVLLAFGEDEAGMLNAVDALRQSPVLSEPGSAAVITPGQTPRVVYRSVEANLSTDPAQIAEERRIEEPPAWAVITGILLIAALAVFAIIAITTRRAAK